MKETRLKPILEQLIEIQPCMELC